MKMVPTLWKMPITIQFYVFLDPPLAYQISQTLPTQLSLRSKLPQPHLTGSISLTTALQMILKTFMKKLPVIIPKHLSQVPLQQVSKDKSSPSQ
jgi:hypothetical protein